MAVSLTPYNASHIEYNGNYFNSSLMKEFNYTIYTNGTLSNISRCYLVFDNYHPYFALNGSVFNGTNCDAPINPIATRAILGIVSSVLFAIGIMLGLTLLRKHGATHLPVEKRFRLVSRRWQWYWLICTAVCGMISGFMAIDVDRNYLQSTALIMQSIFFYVMLPAMLASVWEMTRHWGSFLERQQVDADAFCFPQDDKRSKIEFYIPLVFYLFGFLTFFMSLLRNWNPITKAWGTGGAQTATDPRFRAACFFAFFALVIIIISVFVSLHYYTPRRVPMKIPLCILLLTIRICYNAACAWEYDISPLSHLTNPGWIYGLGYLPIFLIMAVMIFYGWREPNEDQEILKQRREREFQLNVEMNASKGEKKEIHEGLMKLGRMSDNDRKMV
ncbi:uncharacterized protein LAJ45_04369 [Morchella importuna]|uniref:uncharacterized protein n=1 Tax=Morchella importuna TaxID=1174673 RepID=UPI001E8D3927|nr:uncharacterized protein LAJ45_04369 [Morchella importuna]KAH8151747.1 hypothetical protein LAJ45_04369 [Morchella importuna]